MVQLGVKCGVALCLLICALEFFERGHEDFRHIAAAV
jgi:hypothetical protein